METKQALEYFKEFSEIFKNITDLELVSHFNSSVNINAYGIARQGYLNALIEQIDKRKIDYSSIRNKNAISFRYCIFLKDKKLYKLTELDKSEVEFFLNEYLKNSYPEKLIFNPEIVEYDNEILRFRMKKKHLEILDIRVKKMFENTVG